MNNIFKKFKIRDVGTLLRTILQILAYANQIVAAIGQTSFANSPVYQYISLGVTILVTLFTYWYNNNWTSMAELGQEVYDMLKDGELSEAEIKEFLEKHKKEEK